MRAVTARTSFLRVLPRTSTQMDTAKAHTHIAMRCELTAVFPCLLFCGNFEEVQKAVALSTIFRGAKIMQIFHASKTFAIYLTDSYQFHGL